MPNTCTILLDRLRGLPRRAIGFLPPDRESCRCQLTSIGHAVEEDHRTYQWDNRRRRDACLLQYGLRGEGRLENLRTGTVHVVPAGRAILVPFPSPTRYGLPPGGSWEFLYLCFSGPLAFELTATLVRRHGFVHEMAEDGPAATGLVDLYLSCLGPGRPDPHQASARVYALLMELFRVRPAPAAGPPDPVARALRFAGEHGERANLGVADLARAAGCSVFHFSRLFRRHTGLSPYAFLLRERLRRAHAMVATTRIPLKAVAAVAGFGDHPHFCRAFRRAFGCGPSAVRRQHGSFGVEEVDGG